MQVSPIKETFSPTYPKVKEIKDISKLLNNKKPIKWIKNSTIVATFAILTISCNQNEQTQNQTSLQKANPVNKNQKTDNNLPLSCSNKY